jgi:hypothetical protein
MNPCFLSRGLSSFHEHFAGSDLFMKFSGEGGFDKIKVARSYLEPRGNNFLINLGLSPNHFCNEWKQKL